MDHSLTLCVFVNGELCVGFLELSLSFYGRPNISDVHVGKNLVKIFVNSYFSDFEPTFLLFGGSKNAFSKIDLFLRETNLDLSRHPQQVFKNIFFAFFSKFFFFKKNHYILEELRQLCSKFHDFSMKIRGETTVRS